MQDAQSWVCKVCFEKKIKTSVVQAELRSSPKAVPEGLAEACLGLRTEKLAPLFCYLLRNHIACNTVRRLVCFSLAVQS